MRLAGAFADGKKRRKDAPISTLPALFSARTASRELLRLLLRSDAGQPGLSGGAPVSLRGVALGSVFRGNVV